MYSLTTSPPSTPVLGENSPVSFQCIADPPDQMSNVPATIRWEFISREAGAVPVAVVDDGGRVVVGDGTLDISGLRVSDSGMFVCVADHVLVDPVRTLFDLTVEGMRGGGRRKGGGGEGGGEGEGGREDTHVNENTLPLINPLVPSPQLPYQCLSPHGSPW